MKAKIGFIILLALCWNVSVLAQNDDCYRKRSLLFKADPSIKINQISALIEVCGPSALAYFERAKANYELKKYSEAVEDLNKAIEIDPNDAEKYFFRGESILLQTENSLMDEVLKMTRSDRNDSLKLAQCIAKSCPGKQSAVADLTKCIMINPKHVSAFKKRAEIKFLLDDYLGAIGDYTKVLVLNPFNTITYFLRGKANLKVANFQNADADFTKFIEFKSTEQAYYFEIGKIGMEYYYRGQAKLQIGDYKNAIIDFSSFLNKKPKTIPPKGYEKYFESESSTGASSEYVDSYFSRGLAKSLLIDYRRSDF